MDHFKAETWLKELRGKKICSASVVDLLGHGRSAAVFKALKEDGKPIAMKIYDSEFISRFGSDVEEERFNRELSLTGHSCKNLVQIYGGCIEHVFDRECHILLMEYIEGEDLREFISDNRHMFNDAQIRRILLDVFHAADFLFSKNICHRDIKPDNIRIRENGEAVLLDLGVIKPISLSDLTDNEDNKFFLGTLRYSSPELLRRIEDDSVEGWKAVTIYQIGTVLYEIIQGNVLFGHVREPFADLVLTVLQTTPTIQRSDIGEDLIKLTRRSLVKNPKERLSLIKWEDLKEIALSIPSLTPANNTFDQILKSAQETYENKISNPVRMRNEKEAVKQKTLRNMMEVNDNTLKNFQIKPREVYSEYYSQSHSHPSYVLTVSEYYRDLKNHIPVELIFVIHIAHINDDSESLRVCGIGFRGLTFTKPKEMNNIIASNEDTLNGIWEVIWIDPYDKDCFQTDLNNWMFGMFTKYFEDTEGIYNDALKREEMLITGKRGSVQFIETRGGGSWVFNRSKSRFIELRKPRSR